MDCTGNPWWNNQVCPEPPQQDLDDRQLDVMMDALWSACGQSPATADSYLQELRQESRGLIYWQGAPG